MLRVTSAILVAIVLGLAGVALAQTSTSEGTGTSTLSTTTGTTTAVDPCPPDMSLATFRDPRVARRQHANAIRHRKFRGPTHPFRVAHRDVRPCRRGENLGYWGRKVRRARALSPHPLAARAAYWYKTSGAACVKGNEAGWAQGSYATSGGVPIYAGGFQGDDSFMRTYGPEFWRRWGEPRFRWTGSSWLWVNAWPIYAQKITAYRGWSGRGFYPWPNTARECGLI